MSQKLGIEHNTQSQALVDELIETMHSCGTHFTNFFSLIQDNAKN